MRRSSRFPGMGSESVLESVLESLYRGNGRGELPGYLTSIYTYVCCRCRISRSVVTLDISVSGDSVDIYE